jgi:N-acyl homoserine lactone hydrolase
MSQRGQRPSVRIESFHVADFVQPQESPIAGRPGIVMAYAVVHPEGVLLFDTGIGFGDAEIERAYQPVVRDLPDLLRARGIEPDAVTALAVSHLHFDHCGQSLAFPGRPIHVQAAESEAAQGHDYTIPAWVDFLGARYEHHEDEFEVFRGVRLIPTPGHTPGHQSLLVEAAERRTAIVGQAVFTRAEWSGSVDPSVSGLEGAWDRERYRSSVERLRAFRPDTILFGHDR